MARAPAHAGDERAILSSTAIIGTGLVVSGVATLGFFALANRALGVERAGTLATFYVMSQLVGAGLFLALEQELVRAVSAAGAARQGAGTAPRAILRFGLGLCIPAMALCAAAGLVFLGSLSGSYAMVLVLVLMGPGFALQTMCRGIAAGRGHFRGYAACLAADGLLRLLGAGLLSATGSRSPLGYALVLLVAVWLAGGHLVPLAVESLGIEEGAHSQQSIRPLALLVGAQLLGQALLNSGPLVAGLGRGGGALTARVLSALVVARVPLFLLPAVLTPVLSHLSELRASGGRARARAVTGKMLLGILVATALGTVLAWSFGPAVLELAFGEAFALGPTDLALLTGAVGAYAAAMAAGSALLAQGLHGRVLLGWAVGLVGVLLAAALVADPARRVELGFLVGSSSAAAAMATVAVRALRDAVLVPQQTAMAPPA